MTSDVYDSDDALNRSPRLQPQVIKYGPEEQLPPFLHKQSTSGEGGGDSPSSQGSSPGGSRKKRRQPVKPQSSLGDGVLIGFLDPNRPDIARIAAEEPLVVDSSDDDNERTVPVKPNHYHQKSESSRTTSEAALGQAAAKALSLIPDDTPAAGGKPAPFDHGPLLPSIDQLTTENRSPRPSHRQQPSLGPTTEKASEDTLATSPLGKFAISPSDRSPQELLPALQSPPQSAAGGSPENTQSLPSLQSALGELTEAPRRNSSGRINGIPPFPSISAASPPPLPRTVLGRERQLSGPCPPPPTQMPSPYSHVSPMSSKDLAGLSPASQSSYWRPQGLKPDLAHMTSPYDASPRGPQSIKSPAAGYPTPTDLRPDERPALSGPSPPSGPMYKCMHPGCTAPPFQTQYLLNSHANVHSQERPHFCPVPGCPRGVGGKGFKRKNEMIRHGLVHSSPGYVCPFCTDQQHKYPRPDNLQRHVRVHHVDKSKDDPELRKVLSQRPEGSNRGRRRRTHS
ncbi:hypothetical protein VTN77DRAFT_4136 [Rasamsonia byssochlamydoides]|uniref:uncharacterized protein n=1 Tax=Rasamsonia byssochlamydoides TaxID=89139 RepID=UPI0037424A03